MIELVLPYPVSANRYWRKFPVGGKKGGREIIVRSKEADTYIEQIRWIASRARLSKPFDHRVAVELDLYPHRPQDWERRARKDPETWDDTVQCIDLGNAEKVLSDALQGIVFTDDKWIWDLHKRRREPVGEGKVVLRISPLHMERVQADLLGAAA